MGLTCICFITVELLPLKEESQELNEMKEEDKHEEHHFFFFFYYLSHTQLYNIEKYITSSEMYSLHLTHPK